MEDKVIVVASGNQGKIKEFKEMLEPEGYTVKSLSDFPDMPEVEETGTTFHDNAIIKAQAVTDTKIEELTREVRAHNNFAQRVPVLEEQIKVANHRITDLENKTA